MRRKREILVQIGLYLIMIIGLIPVIQSLWADRDDVTTMQENIRLELQNQGEIYSILTDYYNYYSRIKNKHKIILYFFNKKYYKLKYNIKFGYLYM